MRVLLSGGGTAGHIYPALTVAGHLARSGHETTFVGAPDSLEERLATEVGIPFVAAKARGFDRSNPLSLLTSGVLVVSSAVRSIGLVRRLAPDVIVGFGGYVSLPLGIAALLTRVPLVLHEQNSVPGLANRILSRWAQRVAVTYENSIRHLRHPERATLIGNPVRPAVLTADGVRGRDHLGLRRDATVLLVFGGSRGARHINERMIELAPRLLEDPALQVVHVAGRLEAADVRTRIEAMSDVRDAYRVFEYLDDMGDAIAAADLVIARAGATSIAEITAIGRASILVPYPYATDDHQTLNARALAQARAADVVADADIDDEEFYRAIVRLTRDGVRRQAMADAARALARRDATERLAELVTACVRKGQR